MKFNFRFSRRVIPSTARDLLLLRHSLVLCATALLTLTLSLNAQAPEPVPLAHGNMPGEPHHHLKIDNEYVRAYYVEVAPHESTQLHQHDHDYIFVTLGPSDVINAVLDKPEVRLVLKDGETHFTRGGFAHVARNLADTPFRNVTIELLKPQGDAHNLCAQFILGDPLGKCDRPARNSLAVEPEFKTSECEAHLVQLSPRMNLTLHEDRLTFLVVALADSRIRVAAGGKAGTLIQGGEIAWVDTVRGAQFENVDNKTATFLQVTFEAAVANPKH